MRSGNPALNATTFPRAYDRTGGTEAMTIQGTVNKTGLLAICVLVTAAWTWSRVMSGDGSVGPYILIGGIGGFVVALVTEELDLSAILASYRGEKGQPPYHPAMMVALLLYAYAVGIYSSRRIAKACVERVDFMAIVALQAPDFRTISEFRRRHLAALSELFVQVLQLCEAAGLVKLGHVALDGTKIKANASKHKAMSYERMSKRAAELQAEVDGWLEAA